MSNLDDFIQLTNAKVINIKDTRELYTKHFDNVRDALYSLLKKEEPLGMWLSGHKLGGSYADNLKITKADEFDVLFYLNFPENFRIIVEKDPKRPGNVTLDMTKVMNILQDQEHQKITYKCLKELVTSKNLLIEDKLQAMIQGAVTRALNKMDNKIIRDGKTTRLTYRRCGPAHTIFIDEVDMKYSIDFVPAIRLKANQNILGKEELKFFKNIPFWDAIPKPMKPQEPNNVSFRASYYDAEFVMLKDKQKLKEIIKLMKKFRDTKQNMNNLKSYYIKTLLLWQLKVRADSYWSSKPSLILIEMFTELRKCLKCTGEKGKLLFFWDPQLDLFAAFTPNQRADMFNCVNSEIYTLTQADGNLTVETAQHVISSFSSRKERGVERRPKKMHQQPKPYQKEVKLKPSRETQTQLEGKENASLIGPAAMLEMVGLIQLLQLSQVRETGNQITNVQAANSPISPALLLEIVRVIQHIQLGQVREMGNQIAAFDRVLLLLLQHRISYELGRTQIPSRN